MLSDNSNAGSTYQDSTYGVNDANGTRILLNGPERAGQGAAYGTGTENWHQLGDIYCENFEINRPVTTRAFLKLGKWMTAGKSLKYCLNRYTDGWTEYDKKKANLSDIYA